MGLPQLGHGLSPKSLRVKFVGVSLSGVGGFKSSLIEFASRSQMMFRLNLSLFIVKPHRFSNPHNETPVIQPRQLLNVLPGSTRDSKALLNGGTFDRW
jgi:hypothetical protein